MHNFFLDVCLVSFRSFLVSIVDVLQAVYPQPVETDLEPHALFLDLALSIAINHRLQSMHAGCLKQNQCFMLIQIQK